MQTTYFIRTFGFCWKNKCLVFILAALLSVQTVIIFSYFFVDLQPYAIDVGNNAYRHFDSESLSFDSAEIEAEIERLLVRGLLNHLTPVKRRQLYDNASHALASLADFAPPCPLQQRDIVSAVNRAESLTCKHQLAAFHCRLRDNAVFAGRMPNYCPHNGFEVGRSVGCFRDRREARVLPQFAGRVNSSSQCVAGCLRASAVYAGLQYGRECWCGDQRPTTAAHNCDMPCPATTTTTAAAGGGGDGGPTGMGSDSGATKGVTADGVLGSGDALTPAPMDDGVSVSNPSGMCGGNLAVQVYETGRAPFRLATAVNNSVTPTASGGGRGSSDEEPVRIAFLLTLNGRDIRQVQRLLKLIYHGRHCYLLHIDARQHYLHDQLQPLAEQLPNVWLMRRRYAAIWGGASLLDTLVAGMRQLLALPCRWHYVLNLSESDLPVRRLDQLQRYLTANRGRNFLKSHGLPLHRYILKQGLNHTFYECERHMWRLGARALPAVALDGGSDWLCLHRPFVDYAVHGSDALLTAARVFFNHTLLPAESFFHTVLRNSDHCHTLVGTSNLRLTNWQRARGCHCQHKHVVDWCGCSPNNFLLTDRARLQATVAARPVFFARKFESIVSHRIVDTVDEWLHGALNETAVPGAAWHWLNIYERNSDTLAGEADAGTAVDDTLYSLLLSASRWALRETERQCNAIQTDSGGQVQLGKTAERGASAKLRHVLAAHVVRNASDVTVGVAVRFVSDRGAVLEALIRSRSADAVVMAPAPVVDSASDSTLSLQPPQAERLLNLTIGSEFDLKEEVFRNWAGALGVFSTPIVRHSWRAGAPVNVSLVTVEPGGVVARVDWLPLNGSQRAGLSRLAMRHPLAPGVWKLYVFVSGGNESHHHQQQQQQKRHLRLVTSVEFTVLPLQTWRHRRHLLTDTLAARLHGGPPDRVYTPSSNTNSSSGGSSSSGLERWQRLIDRRHRVSSSRARPPETGEALASWADELVMDSFELLRLCQSGSIDQWCGGDAGVVDHSLDPSGSLAVEVCENSDWSALSPDPKSEFHGLTDSGYMIRVPQDSYEL